MNVVCIDDRPPSWGWGELKPLVRGMVYTVVGQCLCESHNIRSVAPGFHLAGHEVEAYSTEGDLFLCNCYNVRRFREVRETSIEQLKLICEPVA